MLGQPSSNGGDQVEKLRATSTRQIKQDARTLTEAVCQLRDTVASLDKAAFSTQRVNGLLDKADRAIVLLERRVCDAEDEFRALAFSLLSSVKRETINVPADWSDRKSAAIVPSDMGGHHSGESKTARSAPSSSLSSSSAAMTAADAAKKKRRQRQPAPAPSGDQKRIKQEAAAPSIARDPVTGRAMVARLE